MVDTDEGVGGPGDAAAVAYSTLHGGFVLQQQNDKDWGGGGGEEVDVGFETLAMQREHVLYQKLHISHSQSQVGCLN